MAAPTPLNPQRFFGEVGGDPVALFHLRHANGMEVAVSNLGAKVLQILVPDRDGVPGDVALGYDSLAALQAGAPSMGAFIGRYAGRIAQARYTLDGTAYTLDANAGPHCIHGGPNGSRHRVFSAHQDAPDQLTLRLRFEPSVDRHPGIVDLTLSYRLTDGHALVIEHEAVAVCTASPASPASFTPHIFFNLDGPGERLIDDHHLQVRADQLLAADADNVATGERGPLDGHALDLRRPRRLGELPDIDHAYELAGSTHGGLRRVAQAHSPVSGRTLDVWTTEPVMQVYTAGALGTGAAPDIGKHGVVHRPRAGLCLEPQQYPNAMNCPGFPLNRVGMETPYRARTEYRFGTRD
ncbi:aldose epimerase family protein [Hydrogenophaga pseudoflava]|uniref:aldose epimerase family protein n=1 Tax=Hydrogenophaga pseudoflava TaxID=47421 RepID=UPI0027E4257D|nr:aldose epimerase family protein [Hydrogenophaga pseudoflava]MDQ7744802.1 aldose epimerase family protein [Hydrogenophaga pseudoflava]